MVFLEKQRVEEIRVTEAMQKIEEDEQKRLVHLQKEEQRKRIESDKKLAQKMEKERIDLEKRLALQKKREASDLKKRLALEKKLALQKKIDLEKQRKERERLALIEKNNHEYLATITESKEIIELEKIDLVESDQLSDETVLFLENSKNKKKQKGFKPLNKWFSTSLTYASKLNNINESNYGREALKATIMVNPYSYFFLGTTLNFDTNSYENIYYQPDFSYSFGYSDWHQDTFSFIYSNYANNKINPKEGKSRFNFQSGNWEVGYKNKIDKIGLSAKVKYLPAKNSKKVYIKAKTTLFEKVMVSAQLKHNITSKQNRLTLSAKTFLTDKLFISGSAYGYYKKDTQGSLDADFAYSFGWKDSRPFYPSISYSNYYTATRWGWKDDDGPHFKDGTISVKFKIKF